MVNKNIVIENASIGFKNFKGEGSQFNPEGKRNFCVFFAEEFAKELQSDGWNIKWLTPRDEGDPLTGYLQVSVSFEHIPPHIFLVSNGVIDAELDEEAVAALDYADIQNIDLIIRPYNWMLHEGTKNEKVGVKAYLKNMYVTLEEDIFAKKYKAKPNG